VNRLSDTPARPFLMSVQRNGAEKEQPDRGGEAGEGERQDIGELRIARRFIRMTAPGVRGASA